MGALSDFEAKYAPVARGAATYGQVLQAKPAGAPRPKPATGAAASVQAKAEQAKAATGASPADAVVTPPPPASPLPGAGMGDVKMAEARTPPPPPAPTPPPPHFYTGDEMDDDPSLVSGAISVGKQLWDKSMTNMGRTGSAVARLLGQLQAAPNPPKPYEKL